MDKKELAELCRARTPESLIAFYEWAQVQEGFKMPAHLTPHVMGLCDTRIDKLMVQVGPGGGKSQLISIVYPAWVLGRNPETTVLGISGAEDLAAGFMNSTSRIIESSEAFRMSFPEVRPDKKEGWSASGYFVTGRRPTVPDASYWACGITSKALTGKHGTLVILDDLHDEANSKTEAQCAQVVRTYSTQIVGRADAQGARFLLAGRRWHESDLYGKLQFNGDWVCITLPAERPGSKDLWVDVTIPEGIECVFTDGLIYTEDDDIVIARSRVPEPEIITTKDGLRIRRVRWKYGEDYMGQGFFWPDPENPVCKRRGPGNEPKRRDYFSVKRLSPAEAEAVYQCNPGARQGSVFIDSDFARRFAPPANLGAGVHDPEVAALVAKGAMVVQAWDTAFSATESSDYTVCTTALLIECDHYHANEDPMTIGECEPHYDVFLLDVYRDRVAFGDLAAKVREMHQRWHPTVIVVEKKAYGVVIVESLLAAGLPIVPVSPGPLESKRARAVEGVGAGSVQGWCRTHRCVFPGMDENGSEPDWLEPFIREMKDFTGEPGNRDDQVDSYVHLVTWAIRNGGSFAKIGGADWGSPEKIDKMMGAQPEGSRSWAQALGFADMNDRPRLCASCRYFARKRCGYPGRNMPTLSIGTCENHAYEGEEFDNISGAWR